MKKIIFFTVLGLLCLKFCIAQESAATKPPQPVPAGSKIPESFWSFQHEVYQDGKLSKQTLAAHKGKIIILGFWASFCGPCLTGLDTLMALQKKFPNELYVIGVNTANSRDDFQKIDKLFSGQAIPFKIYHNASIIYDTYLRELFPGLTVPKYVWIDQFNHLNAITGKTFVNTASVQKLIDQYKKDQQQ